MEQKINKDLYLSISQFSKLSGISRKKLIFYDRMNVFSPEIVLDNGYRYYYYRQLYTINMFLTLKAIGMPLKDIKKFTDNRSPESLIELFSSKKKDVRENIENLIQIESMMKMQIETAQQALNVQTEQVEVQYFERDPIFIAKDLVLDSEERKSFSRMLTKFYQYADLHNYHTTFPWGVALDLNYYSDENNHDTYQSNFNLEKSLNFYYRIPKSKTCKPSGKYLVLYAYGHDNRENNYKKICAYAKKHNYTLKNILYEDYLINEISTNIPEKYLTRLSIPIE